MAVSIVQTFPFTVIVILLRSVIKFDPFTVMTVFFGPPTTPEAVVTFANTGAGVGAGALSLFLQDTKTTVKNSNAKTWIKCFIIA